MAKALSKPKSIKEKKIKSDLKPEMKELDAAAQEPAINQTGAVDKKTPIHSIYLHILWNIILAVAIPFIVLFGLTFGFAKTSIDSQINDTLGRGLETFKYFSKEAIEQVLGIKVDVSIASAFAAKDAGILKSFLDEQQGDRSWIDIWLALDADGKIITSLSNAPEGTLFPRPAIIQKAVKAKKGITADDVVSQDQWYSTYGDWSSSWQGQNTNESQGDLAADIWNSTNSAPINDNTNEWNNTNAWVNANFSDGSWNNQNSNTAADNLNANVNNGIANTNNWSDGNTNSWNSANVNSAPTNSWQNEWSGQNSNASAVNSSAGWPAENTGNTDWNSGPKERMVNYIVIPVFSANGAHLGTIVVGSTVNNNNWTAERIGSSFQAIAGVTIQNTIAATNLKSSDGKTAAVGIKIPQEAADKALINKLYEGRGIVNGAAYRLAVDPINDVSGKFIGTHFVAIPESQANKIWRDLSSILLVAFVGSLVLAVILAYFIARKIAKPIKILSEAAHKIGAGDFNAAIDIKGDDEIAQLGKDFTQMEKDLKKRTEEVGRFSKEAKEKTKLLDDKEKILRKRETEITDVQNKLAQKEKALADAIEEQKKLTKVSVERETKMMEMKKEIEELKSKIGQG